MSTNPLDVLHRAANCRCFVQPVIETATLLAPVVCPECEQGKCGNCDGSAWDHETDQPAACECAHGSPS